MIDTQTTKISRETLKQLRMLHALTGERMIVILARLVEAELTRVQEADMEKGYADEGGHRVEEVCNKLDLLLATGQLSPEERKSWADWLRQELSITEARVRSLEGVLAKQAKEVEPAK